MAIDKAVYTAHATSTGGRTGTTESSDGAIKLALATPKELGGAGGPGTNPEQLFAAGYSACFIGAMKAVAGRQKISLPAEVSIASSVAIGPMTGKPGAFQMVKRPDSETTLDGNQVVLEDQMAKTPAAVDAFMAKLVGPTRAKAAVDLVGALHRVAVHAGIVPRRQCDRATHWRRERAAERAPVPPAFTPATRK